MHRLAMQHIRLSPMPRLGHAAVNTLQPELTPTTMLEMRGCPWSCGVELVPRFKNMLNIDEIH
jgi:hypothetical protein